MRKNLIAVLVLSGVTSCASWPDSGSGGYAEHEILQVRFSISAKEYLKLSQLHHEWQVQDLRYQLLKLNGAKECLPALMYRTEQQNNRTIRTIHASLFLDSEVELIKFKRQLNSIDTRMQGLGGNVECTSNSIATYPDDTKNVESVKDGKKFKAVLELLNTTLQFSTASNELLPQYHSYLVHAARVLKTYPKIGLQIIGHADDRGDSIKNNSLSLSRAEKVKNILVKNGIDVSRLFILAKGDASPIISGNSEFEYLANRRVEIKIVDSISVKKLSSLSD